MNPIGVWRQTAISTGCVSPGTSLAERRAAVASQLGSGASQFVRVAYRAEPRAALTLLITQWNNPIQGQLHSIRAQYNGLACCASHEQRKPRLRAGASSSPVGTREHVDETGTRYWRARSTRSLLSMRIIFMAHSHLSACVRVWLACPLASRLATPNQMAAATRPTLWAHLIWRASLSPSMAPPPS